MNLNILDYIPKAVKALAMSKGYDEHIPFGGRENSLPTDIQTFLDKKQLPEGALQGQDLINEAVNNYRPQSQNKIPSMNDLANENQSEFESDNPKGGEGYNWGMLKAEYRGDKKPKHKGGFGQGESGENANMGLSPIENAKQTIFSNPVLSKYLNKDNFDVIFASPDRTKQAGDNQLEFWKDNEEGTPDFPTPIKGKNVAEIYSDDLKNNPQKLSDAVFRDALHYLPEKDATYNQLRNQLIRSTPKDYFEFLKKENGDTRPLNQFIQQSGADALIRGAFGEDSEFGNAYKNGGDIYNDKQRAVLKQMQNYLGYKTSDGEAGGDHGFDLNKYIKKAKDKLGTPEPTRAKSETKPLGFGDLKNAENQPDQNLAQGEETSPVIKTIGDIIRMPTVEDIQQAGENVNKSLTQPIEQIIQGVQGLSQNINTDVNNVPIITGNPDELTQNAFNTGTGLLNTAGNLIGGQMNILNSASDVIKPLKLVTEPVNKLFETPSKYFELTGKINNSVANWLGIPTDPKTDQSVQNFASVLVPFLIGGGEVDRVNERLQSAKDKISGLPDELKTPENINTILDTETNALKLPSPDAGVTDAGQDVGNVINIKPETKQIIPETKTRISPEEYFNEVNKFKSSVFEQSKQLDEDLKTKVWTAIDEAHKETKEKQQVNTLFEVQNHFGDKRSIINLPNEKSLELRITDHSGNYNNVKKYSNADRTLSIVIGDDATKNRFANPNQQMPNELYFDGTEKPEDIIKAVSKKIEAIKSEETDNKTFGAFNEDINKRREERNLSPLEEPLRKGNAKTWDKVKTDIQEGKVNPRDITQSVKNKPRPLSDEETVALHQDAIKLHNDKQEVLNQLDEAYKKGEDTTDLEGRKITLDQLQKDNDEALKKGGTETARALQVRQLMANQEMELVNVLRDARLANPEKPLTAKEESFYKSQTEAYQKAHQELQARLSQAEERISQLEAQKTTQRLKRQADFEQRQAKRKSTKEEIASNLETLKNQLLENAKKRSGKLSANAIFENDIPVLTKIAKEYVKSGIVDATELVDKVYNHVKDIYDNINIRDIRDALSGYGRKSVATKDELITNFKNARTEMKLISKIEDAQKNIKPERKIRGEQPQRITDLKLQLEAELKKRGLKEDISTDAKLKSYKTRLENNIKDYTERLKSGNYDREPRKTLNLDNETLKLKANAEALRDKIKNEIRKRELANRPPWEKLMDIGIKSYRQMLLSGATTVLKLTNYGALKTLVMNGIEDTIGEGLGKIPKLKEAFEKAPSQGSVGISNALKIYAKSSAEWTKRLFTMFNEAGRRQLKTGKSALDYAYNETHLPPEVLEFFGHLHGVLKEPTKQANFMRSLERRTLNALKEGQDINNPQVLLNLQMQAYTDAKASILLGDNKINAAFNRFLGDMERSGTGGKVLRGIAQLLFPIAKVPTNFVLDTLRYGLGGFKAAAKLLTKGIKNLTPEEADMVTSLLKKQIVGIGAIAIGALNPDNFGGYYMGNEKRKKGDVKPGKVRLYGYDLPSWMTHLPQIEAMQMGATFVRAINAVRKNNGEEPIDMYTEIKEGILASALGLVEEIPFLGETIKSPEKGESLGEAFDKNVGEKVSGFIPNLIRPYTYGTDTKGDKTQGVLKSFIPTKDAPETIQRKPEGILQTIESNIPGLRETISSKEDVKTREFQEKRVKEGLMPLPEQEIKWREDYNALDNERDKLRKEIKEKPTDEARNKFRELTKQLKTLQDMPEYEKWQDEKSDKREATKKLEKEILN